jgi:hypothetical protein
VDAVASGPLGSNRHFDRERLRRPMVRLAMPSTVPRKTQRKAGNKKTVSCCRQKASSVSLIKLSCCHRHACFACLSKICSKDLKDKTRATCWKCSKEIALDQVELVLSRAEYSTYSMWYRKPSRADCVSCSTKKDTDELRVAPCGHYYCLPCLYCMCRLALGDRTLVPLRCCKKELPDDYVREALVDAADYAKYQKLVLEKDWKVSELQSDAEYTATVRAVGAKQCPGCGIGVQRDFGCVHMTCPNGHQFCFTCVKPWGSCNCPLIPEHELRAILGE